MGKRLSRINKLIATLPGQAETTELLVEKLPRLLGKKKNLTVYFLVVAKCEAGEVSSNVAEIKIKRRPRGKIKFRKYIQRLQNKLSLFSVSLEDSFPNLSFDKPVDLQFANDNTSRLFVVEQTGKIKVFDEDLQRPTASTFLDLTSLISSAGEQGVLGVAFHPNYNTNRYLYVHYTRKSDGASVVSRFQADLTNPDLTNLETELPLFVVFQPFSNHNGGQISFGPDGYLYISIGDGGGGGDPAGNGQDLETLLGSILRIDVDNSTSSTPYAIPSDNPFVGNINAREEIFAYGLRNTWRFSFDSLTGNLWAADVGQNAFEEINLIQKGSNYGWNQMEGFECYSIGTNCNKSGLEPPVYTYPRNVGTSITGGYLYRGEIRNLRGKYVYADFVRGKIWALDSSDAGQLNNLLLNTDSFFSAFGQNKDNELYVLSYFDGKLLKLVQ